MAELVTRRESIRLLCKRMGMPDWMAEVAASQGDKPFWPGYWEELVEADTGHRPGGMLRWVRPNRDKPHRCPLCHHVRTWHRERYGPRTRLTCPPCGVQWRSGVRVYPWPLRALRRR